MADIVKIGLLVLRGDQVLFCRKNRETSKLILPGGRVESGESDSACLARELREELGDVHCADLELVGTYQDRAAHDDPSVVRTLRLTLYRGRLEGEPRPCSEIRELVWFGPTADRNQLSPIFLNQILPDLLRRRLIPWENA
jgi:8-oxo-dGTP diphosphatase